MNLAEFKKSLKNHFPFEFKVEQTSDFVLFAASYTDDTDYIYITYRMKNLEEEFFDLETQTINVQCLSSLDEVKKTLIEFTKMNINKLNHFLSLFE